MNFLRAKFAKNYMAASKIRSVAAWIVEILIVLALGIGLAFGFGQVIVMQEGSMEPTLEAGEKLLVNRAVYRTGAPKRGDLIVFYTGEDHKTNSNHIKRVIGLPGETVQIKEGKILIDGEILQENAYFPEIENPGMAETEMTLDGGEYFVLGDNVNNSEDSRFVNVGCIKSGNIIGKVWFRISPRDKFGFISDKSE